MKLKNLSDCKAVIFDMDGVLVHTEDHYKIVEQEVYNSLGLTISPEEHLNYQGTSNPLMWERIKAVHNLTLTVDELVDLTEQKVADFFNSLSEIEPMPGVIDLLNFLQSKKIEIALASSSVTPIIKLVLQKAGLKQYFKLIVDSIEAGAGKPNPAIFLLAQKKINIPKEKCLILEDSENGIKAAKAAGIFCIAYNGPGSEFMNQSAADRIIKDFAELILNWDNTAQKDE